MTWADWTRVGYVAIGSGFGILFVGLVCWLIDKSFWNIKEKK